MINLSQSKIFFFFFLKSLSFWFFLNKRSITLERRQIILNEYIESQTEKHNFSFPQKSISSTPPIIEKPESPVRDPTNLLVKFRDQSTSKRSPSPNPKSSTSKLNNLFHRFLKEQQQPTKRMLKNITLNSTTSINQQIQPQSVLKPQIKQTNNVITRKSVVENEGDYNDQQANDYENDDIRIINEHVHEYYYAIRILPGQNPRSVFIGWVTSRFKPIYRQDQTSPNTLDKLIRYCTVTQLGDDGTVIESIQRQDAYMFCASDLLDNIIDKENVARRVVNGLLIGCLCDVSTGQLTFYVNGKESTQKLQV
jgi:hypothetical protein